MPRRYAVLPPVLRLFWKVDPVRASVLVGCSLVLGLIPLVEAEALRRLVLVAQRLTGIGGQAGGLPATILPALIWGGALSLLAVVDAAVRQVTLTLRQSVGEGLRLYLHERIYRVIHTLPLAELEEPRRHDQRQRLTRGLEERMTQLVLQLVAWLAYVVTIVSLLAYLLVFHWALPLALLAGSLPGGLVRYRYAIWRVLLERRQTAERRRFNVLSGLLTGRQAAAEVRLFGLGDWLIGEARRLWRHLVDEELSLAARFARASLGAEWANVLAYGLVLVVGVQLLATGRLELATAAALLLSVERFQSAVRWTGQSVVEIYGDLRYLEEYFELVGEAPLSITAVGRPIRLLRQGIDFEDVSFTYPGEPAPALRSIDLHIRRGDRIALAGENGAGKSTLVKLLMGLYQPSSGRILLDGVDLRAISPTEWQARIGAVFQDFLRFETTVRENIGAGWIERLDDAEAIERAARLSGAADVAAALPDGMETALGRQFHDGLELSHGQWQALAIARAYLRPAEVLILDEPASALDARAEVAVYEHFARIADDRTVLLISHRLGACRLASRVVFLKAGQIVEQGGHEALLAAGGEYATLYQMQAAWYR